MNRASRYSGSATVLAFVRVVIVAFCVCVCHRAQVSDGKVFERCELAQVLRYGHGLDVNDVANWVCITQHSSSLNTSAYGGNARSGGSHGLFQISDQYWCSPPGKGVACGVACDRLRDDDISDDVACVQLIYEEHQRLSGDGYKAWIAYQSFCRDNPYEYVEDCFGNEEREYLHSKSLAANVVEDEEEEEDDSAVYSRKRGKVYGRCELAKELFLKHKMPMEEIPTWVCIAQHESNYDTSAVGRLNADGSADHGLFQISDLYWCHHKGGRRKACGMPCSKLLDTDITDDVKCVKQIYKEHTRIAGDGFTAWTVYNAHCRGNMAAYVRGCFDGIDVDQPRPSEEYRKAPTPTRTKSTRPHGKVYEPCELAEELRTKHLMPEDQIATWVCIAKHESDYNTSAIGYGDHGLFQISDIYWCSPPGKGWACGLSCADLEDSDITDDVECIRKIHNEHTRLTGDGFNAWTVYPRHCSKGRSAKYIAHCPGHHHQQPAIAAQSQAYTRIASPNSIAEYEPKRGKVYGRCELAKELLEKHDMDMEEIPTWVCIAHHESNFDTSAIGRLNADGSADHGIFQISDLFWCSHKEGHRKACGLPCSKLLDNDISDDVRCVKQIHAEHTRISGDGFTAWSVYNPYCSSRTEQYVRGCFDGSADEEAFAPPQRALSPGYAAKNKPKGKVFEECELANELRDKHRVPKEQIATWVCIAQHQSGLNTSSSVSNVHGLFHISDEFWCSPPGKGQACELNCADLEDSDITDDVQCIQKIYEEHQRLFGDGFNAWVAYSQYCNQGRANNYIGHCSGFKSTTVNSYGSQSGVIKTHPKLGGRVIEISNQPVYSHEFQANPFLKHFEVANSKVIAPTFTQPAVSKPTFDHVFNANPFLKHIDTVGSNFIVPSTTQAPTSKPTFGHEFSVNPFLRHHDTKSKASFAGLFSTSEKYTASASGDAQATTRKPALNPFSLNPFLRTISAGFAAITTPKPVFGGFSVKASTAAPTFGGFSIKTSTPAPAFGGFSIRPTPTRTKAIGVKTYFPQNEEKAKYEAFKSLAQPYLPLSTQTPRANRLETYTLNTLRSPFSSPSQTSTASTTSVPWYQLNTLNSAKPIVKPESTSGFFFNQDSTASTAKPNSVTSFTTAKPQVTFKGAVATSTQTTTLRPITVVSFSTVKPEGASFNRAAVSPVQTFTSRPFSAFNTPSSQGFSGFSFNRGVSSSTRTTTLRPVTSSFNRAATQAITSKPFSVFISNTAQSSQTPSGFSFNKAVTPTTATTTLRPISAGSYTSRAPQTSVKEDTGRYDPGRYDAGRYDSGRYDSGRYDSGKYNPQPFSRTTASSSTSAKTTVSSFGHYPTPTPTPTLRPREQTTSRISITTLRPSSPVITFPHPTAQPQTSRFLSKFLSSEEDDSLPQASNTNEQTIQSISRPISGVKITNLGNVGISVHKPAVTSQGSEQYLPNTAIVAAQNVGQSLATPSLPTGNLKGFQLTGSSSPFQVDGSLLPGSSGVYISPSFTSKRDTTASEIVKNPETAKDYSQTSLKSAETFEINKDSSQMTLKSSGSSGIAKDSNLMTLKTSSATTEVSSQTSSTSLKSQSSKDFTPTSTDSPRESDSSEVLTSSSQKSPESESTKQEVASSQTGLKELLSITPTAVDSLRIQSSSVTADLEPISSSSSEPAVPSVSTAEQESSKPESDSVKQTLNPSINLKPIPKTSSAFTAGSAKSPVALNPTSTAASQAIKSSFRQNEALTPSAATQSSTSTSQILSSTETRSPIATTIQRTGASLITPSSVPAASRSVQPSPAQSLTSPGSTFSSQLPSRSVIAATVKPPGVPSSPPKIPAVTQPIRPSLKQTSISTGSTSSRQFPSRSVIAATVKQPEAPSITPKVTPATKFIKPSPAQASISTTSSQFPIFSEARSVTSSTSAKKPAATTQSSAFKGSTSESQFQTSGNSRSPIAATIKQPGASSITPKILSATMSIQPSPAQSSVSTRSAAAQFVAFSQTRSPIATTVKQSTSPAIAAQTRSSSTSQAKATQWTWSRPTTTSTSKPTSGPAKPSFNAIKSAPTFPAKPVPTPTLKKSGITSVRGSAQTTPFGAARLPTSATTSRPWQWSATPQQTAFRTPTRSAPTRVTLGTSKPSSIFTSKPSPSQSFSTQQARTTSSRSTRSITTSSSSTRINGANSIIVTKPIQSSPPRPSLFGQTSAVKSSPSPIIKTRPSTLITPTKSHRPSGSLFSTQLNIFDFYSKLYGSYPATKTSSAQPAASQTRQFNVAPSRTS